MAMETQDEKQMLQAILDTLAVCIVDEYNINKLKSYDVEYIFLSIRSKSVGEVSKLRLLCPDDEKTYADVELNLNEVKVQVGDNHTNKIDLGNDMGMIMKYPTIDSFSESGIKDINPGNMLDVISTCILQIFEKKGEKVYDTKDQTKQELTEFIESLNTKQFKDVQNFFETMPKLKHDITIKNPKTKVESKITLAGLNDFFA